jgi:ABC-type transporter Mla MlaB component
MAMSAGPSPMLRITAHTAADEYLLKLEGCLAGEWVPELAACWRELTTSSVNPHVRLDLTEVCHVDDAGRELMTTMYRAGVRFVAQGFVIPELVREISESVDGYRRT